MNPGEETPSAEAEAEAEATAADGDATGHAVAVTGCAECGFVYEHLSVGEVPAVLGSLGRQWVEVLGGPGVAAIAATRPTSETWSALEYACHVRDVLLVQRDRVVLALVEDHPTVASMHRDERVVLAGYGDESVDEAARGLAMAVDLAARVFDRLTPEQAARRCVYNFPRTDEHDVTWLGQHTVHEVRHHLGDVRSVLDRVAPRRRP